jgi:hypothetical protein
VSGRQVPRWPRHWSPPHDVSVRDKPPRATVDVDGSPQTSVRWVDRARGARYDSSHSAKAGVIFGKCGVKCRLFRIEMGDPMRKCAAVRVGGVRWSVPSVGLAVVVLAAAPAAGAGGTAVLAAGAPRPVSQHAARPRGLAPYRSGRPGWAAPGRRCRSVRARGQTPAGRWCSAAARAPRWPVPGRIPSTCRSSAIPASAAAPVRRPTWWT